jgi:23S rRNA (cytidine1920-2'-O)/16S rRNA (cytidine1409-2'-O)-methyltransferase
VAKIRVDVLIVARGLAESRAFAQRLVMAGQVRANGERVHKPSDLVAEDAALAIEGGGLYVSRGGEKLAAALAAFGVSPAGLICADVGASTGGFTDCLLQNGAAKVYAIDVGHGILHWKLRQDSRVIVMEKTNARYAAQLPEPIELVTVDASFISLKVLLPVIQKWLTPAGNVIALIKPQFEAGRKEAARGRGVVRDPEVHAAILRDVLSFAEAQGCAVRGLIRSPIEGPKGNVEFLARLELGGQPADGLDGLVRRAGVGSREQETGSGN